MASSVSVHAMTPAGASAALGEGLEPLVGPLRAPVSRLSGPQALLDDAAVGLPEGPARAEAVAVRLRRRGVTLTWGAAEVLPDARSYLRASSARGASSLEMVRADPSLLTELQLGAFFNVYWPTRVLRRLLVASPDVIREKARLAAAADAAFWAGVRAAATETEWARLTRSSYVVLMYHRLAGERVPGQERLDVDPKVFARHLRWLRRLGFRPLSCDELVEFHESPFATLPPRSFVLTADDGFLDAVAAARLHVSAKPHLFVNTSLVGGRAPWADDRPIAGWDELRGAAAAGAAIGSHARSHRRLAETPTALLAEELTGSLRELQARVPSAVAVLAYPHGSHDERVRAAAIAAGYRAAFTSQPGRNGAGTDPYCLRRLSMKDWDGPLALLWKTLTGEVLPPLWDRWAQRLRHLGGT